MFRGTLKKILKMTGFSYNIFESTSLYADNKAINW